MLISKSFLNGFFWMGSLRGVSRGLSLAKMAILARFLTPSQFGVYGIATVVLAFLETATETGINIFLIQRKKDIDKYINSAWVVSIARGFIIFVILLILSPVIASFFNAPNSVQILILTSFIPLVRGFINPASVIYQKNLEFKKQFFYESGFFVIDALVAISLGIFTKSENSLVLAMLASALVEVIFSFKVFKTKPKLKFENETLKEVVHEGKWITGAGIFSYLFHHLDDIFVGKLLGAYTLGIYQQAYRISSIPVSEVGEVFNKVSFPVISNIDGDNQKIKKEFIKNLILICLFVIPIGVILFKFPFQIINLVFGSNWLEAVSVLQLLSIYGVLKAISNSFFSLFLGVRKQKLVTIITLIQAVVMFILIYPLIKIFGVLGAGYSAIIATTVSLPFFVYYSWKILK